MPHHGSEYENFTDKNPLLSRDSDHFSKLRSKVQEHLRLAYEKTKKSYDLRTRVIPYEIGDIFYRVNNNLSDAGVYYSSKLAPRSIESKIIERTGTNTYLLRDVNTGKEDIYQSQMFHKWMNEFSFVFSSRSIEIVLTIKQKC